MKRIITAVLLFMHIANTAFCQERDICADFANNTNGSSVTATMNNDAGGCYILISYLHNYSTSGLSGLGYPHGLELVLTNATFTPDPGTLTGIWFTAAPAPTYTASGGGDEVRWKKPFVANQIPPPYQIPPNSLLTIKKYVNIAPGAISITVRIYELSGVNPGTDFEDRSLCLKDFTFNTPPVTYSIGPNTSVCSGTFLTLNVTQGANQPPPAGATVTWYRSNSGTCPSVSPWDATGWGVPAQTGGNSYNTNDLTSGACIVAVVKQGCWSYISNVKTIAVCQGPPGGTITAAPIGGYPALQLLNNQYHACKDWKGELDLAVSSSTCPLTGPVSWEEKPPGGAWTQISSNLSIYINLPYTPGCSNEFDFRAKLVNACGTTYVPYTIIVDNKPDGGTIKTQSNNFYDVGTGINTAPVLCYNTGTRLVHTTGCGQIKNWEYRDEATPCSNAFPGSWLPVAGSNGTSTWFTNNLTKTRQYRAVVGNGVCLLAYSDTITVKVKPELTVNIAAQSTFLCMHPILTATTSYGAPCNYPIASYQWYLNGVAIPGATIFKLAVTQPGNYSVTVTDGQCKTDAKSNVLTICDAKLAVTASSCCVCHANDSVALSAVMTFDPTNCGAAPTYLWSTGAATASIHVTQPGHYSVTVHWGGCTLTASTTVGSCP